MKEEIKAEDMIERLGLEEKPKLTLYVIMQRIWRILLIVGFLGIVSEFVFLLFSSMIYGDEEQGLYAFIWLGLSIMALSLSIIIAGIVYSRPYVKKIRDWVYFV